MASSKIDYVLIGHITADIIPEGRELGGTVSYAARTAAAFGLRVGILTSARPDDPLLEELAESAAELIVLPAESTTTFENIYTPAGREQFIRGVAAPINLQDVPPDWMDAPLVHLAPIAGDGDPALADLFPNSTIMLTLQGWLRRWEADGRVRFRSWHDEAALKRLDFVVFSEEDIVEAPEMEQRIAAAGRDIIVTRAYDGGTYYHHGEPYHYRAFPADVVHPTGAGDVFATSLLAAWKALDGDMHAALKVAAELGAHSVTRVGLDSAPTPDEVRAALDSARQTG